MNSKTAVVRTILITLVSCLVVIAIAIGTTISQRIFIINNPSAPSQAAIVACDSKLHGADLSDGGLDSGRIGHIYRIFDDDGMQTELVSKHIVSDYFVGNKFDIINYAEDLGYTYVANEHEENNGNLRFELAANNGETIVVRIQNSTTENAFLRIAYSHNSDADEAYNYTRDHFLEMTPADQDEMFPENGAIFGNLNANAQVFTIDQILLQCYILQYGITDAPYPGYYPNPIEAEHTQWEFSDYAGFGRVKYVEMVVLN